MLATLALLSLVPTSTAQDAMMEVRRSYESMQGFSMTIAHHDSSGLFPGEYEQMLSWKKGGVFELKISKPVSGNPSRKAPDYYCNGKYVWWAGGSSAPGSESVLHDPNSSPGWEV